MNESSTLKKLSLIVKFPLLALSVTALMLAACGGGGGGSGGGSGGASSSNGNPLGWTFGVYKPSDTFVNYCENPRWGVSKITGLPFPDKGGSSLYEKHFLRSWSFETYLWLEDLRDVNPDNTDTPQAYFDRLKSNLTTASGSRKDNFHFYEPTEDQEAWSAGITYGYGLNLKANWYIPRKIYVTYSDTGSPAANKGIKRGAEIIAVNGVGIDYVDIDRLFNALYPTQANAVNEFELRDAGASVTRKVTLESGMLPTDSVSTAKTITHNGSKVGYVQFNTFNPDAQDQWVTAINTLKNEGVTDLVVDMRYNGGGYIAVAAQVGYMIAGANTTNKIFFQDVANSKSPKEDPWPFFDTGVYGLNKSLALPTLNLSRVYVLSTKGTCSASELVINSLRGIGVSVFLIGDTTCGKPYGFVPQPNCGTTYYTIQFKAVNAKGYGEYSNGFMPASNDNGLDQVKGCRVADDLSHELGDPNEALLGAALQLRATGTCPPASFNYLQKPSPKPFDGELVRPGVREIMIRE